MKPMNDEDQKRRMAALAEGKRIVTKRYRNPVYGNRSLKENVEEEMGNPMPVTVDRKKAARMAMDKFIDKRRNNLPRLSDVGNPGKEYEMGNPKEDLSEISGQLKKASRLHANQSDRVGKIAKKMKGEQGNPHMKKSKSKYGM